MSAPSLAQKVTNIKHMPVLLAATSATKDPADGYLVKDVIKMSYESHQTRMFLQQYLVNQLLTTNNVFSKIKILRLFLDLLEEGHIEFKQNLRRTPEPFNEAAKLRPHQPKDQKLVSECGRIRDMANKVLDLLYAEVPELRKGGHPVDSTDYGGEMSSGSNGSSRITGFGNTGAAPGGKSPSTTDKLKALFGTSGSKSNAIVYDPSYATMDPVPHNTSANTPFSVHVPSSGGYRDSASRPTGLPHAKGQAGGGWGVGSDHKPSSAGPSKWSASAYQEQPGDYEEDQREHLSSTGEDLSRYEESSTEQEQRLVDEITAPGGVKIAPPKENLNRFVARCKVLDSQSVVECLRLKLLSEESQTVLRALFVIEHLLRSDIPDILSHLDIILQDLSNLTQSPNSSVQAKAKKISAQLLSVTTAQPAPPPSVSNGGTSRSHGTQQLSGSYEQEQEEEGEEEEESSGISSIFSGLSVSGEKGATRSKPARKKKKQPSPSSAPRGGVARGVVTVRKAEEERKGFEDILGLGDLSADAQQPSASTGEISSEAAVLQQQPPLLSSEPPPAAPDDDSLLTFEEDVEFDPLKRSDSVTSSSRNNSVKHRGTNVAGTPVTSNTGLGSTHSRGVVEPSPAASTETRPPLTSRESLGHIQDLTGVDLNITGGGGGVSAPIRQDSLSELLQPKFTMSGAVPMSMPTSVGMVPQGTVIVSAPSGTVPPLGMQPGGVVYGAAQAQVPLVQPGVGGVAFGAGGGAQPMVPVMYAAQGTAGVMYQPAQFGGMARPVQRATVAKEQTPPPDTGFSFLASGKTNKNNAFDFVQEEMKASWTRK